MSGGFPLSGGEPLLQDRFAVKLFAAAKAMGIHTALDTDGSLGERLTDDELSWIDLVLLDIKTWDPERHRRLTGAGVRAPPFGVEGIWDTANLNGVPKKPATSGTASRGGPCSRSASCSDMATLAGRTESASSALSREQLS
ncbi:MAG: hypothetical protein ACRD1X_17500 [Vicinamibacteria bacterium]